MGWEGTVTEYGAPCRMTEERILGLYLTYDVKFRSETKVRERKGSGSGKHGKIEVKRE